MQTKVVSGIIFKEADFSEIPNGKYKAFWGGYEVAVKIKGIEYRFKTEVGIRTMNAPCFVVVKNGEISITD